MYVWLWDLLIYSNAMSLQRVHVTVQLELCYRVANVKDDRKRNTKCVLWMNILAFWCFYGSCKLRHATVAMAVRGWGGADVRCGVCVVARCSRGRVWHMLGGNALCSVNKGGFHSEWRLKSPPPTTTITAPAGPPLSPVSRDSSLGQCFPQLP